MSVHGRAGVVDTPMQTIRCLLFSNNAQDARKLRNNRAVKGSITFAWEILGTGLERGSSQCLTVGKIDSEND